MLQFACSALSTTADFFKYGCSCGPDEDDLAMVADLQEAIEMASDMLCILSAGRVFGRCTKIVHPFGDGGGCFPIERYGRYGQSVSPFGGFSAIPLRGPQPEVIEVRIDNQVVATSAYRIIRSDGMDYLLRTDGASWPSANSFDVTDDASWTITHRFGPAPDKITRDATNEVACELIKDFEGRKSLLPPGVTNLNLQGASAQLEDAADALSDGAENMPAVARFLGIYNPEDRRAVSGIWSPELSLGWTLYEVHGVSGS